MSRRRKSEPEANKDIEIEGNEEEELIPDTGVHHTFDNEFMHAYPNLLQMLLDRGYSGDGIPGINEEEQTDVTPETRGELIARYGGLERFSLQLFNQDPGLNMEVYYIVPLIGESSSVERKQINETQIKALLTRFTKTDFSRLLLISRTKLSAPAANLIAVSNSMTIKEKPYSLIQFLPLSFFAYNPVKSIYQPDNIRIHRPPPFDPDNPDAPRQVNLLEELAVAPEYTNIKASLLPQMYDTDRLALYYGLKADDVVTYIRTIPRRVFYARVIVRNYDL